MGLKISDAFLTMFANTAGVLAVLLIIVYQFIEVNAKREKEIVAEEEAQSASTKTNKRVA